MKILLLFCLFLNIFSFASFANEACVNDLFGQKKAKDEKINALFEQAQDPLIQDFLQSQINSSANKSDGENSSPSDCKSSLLNAPAEIKSSLSFLHNTSKIKQIKKACIVAALQAQSNNTGYVCDGNKVIEVQNNGQGAPCLNQKVVDYLHYVTNKAISCVSANREPIDPRFILKKLNLETGFNFFLASKIGVGLGQLTSDSVRELAGWHEGRTAKHGNAEYFLKEIINSQDSACLPFAKILQNDLKSPPKINSKNYCSWTNPEHGIAKNVIYSVMYYAFLREHIIQPSLQKKSRSLAEDSDIVNYLTLTAYSKGGAAKAIKIINDLKLDRKSNPKKTIENITKNNTYVENAEEKMSVLNGYYKAISSQENGHYSPAEFAAGDACVETPK
ncbi:MAG: hypothetical protein ACXVCY_05555 [Pseudobdellovibrionaceae bacterium]